MTVQLGTVRLQVTGQLWLTSHWYYLMEVNPTTSLVAHARLIDHQALHGEALCSVLLLYSAHGPRRLCGRKGLHTTTLVSRTSNMQADCHIPCRQATRRAAMTAEG